MNSAISSALIAAGVSVAVTVLTTVVTIRSSKNQARQTQFAEVIKKRIELYPKLWAIHIEYETNWQLESRPKSREWASDYVSALNSFNLEGGAFFSQALYRSFHELREALYGALQNTPVGLMVDRKRTDHIRQIVYGDADFGSGMSTYEKDDLGSYQTAMLQRRARS